VFNENVQKFADVFAAVTRLVEGLSLETLLNNNKIIINSNNTFTIRKTALTTRHI
jgi:hypothetical protein